MKLKEIRKEKKITQQEVAEKLHISQSYYARIEKGKGILTDKIIITLCKYFNISADELLGLK